jgi:hypothetical protein
MSWVRKYRLPRLEMPSIFVLPPVECWRGVRPNQAARSRPRAGGSVADCRHQRGGVDHANARNPGQPSSAFILACHVRQFLVISSDTAIELSPFVAEIVKQMQHACAQCRCAGCQFTEPMAERHPALWQDNAAFQ